MTATIEKSLGYDRAASLLFGQITASVSSYTDPTTHIMSKSFYYHLSLDQQVLASGLRSGSVTLPFSQMLGQGYHALSFFAGNAQSGEHVTWNVDIQNYAQSSLGQVLRGRDETPGSDHVDFVVGSDKDDFFYLGQNDDIVHANGGNDYINGGAGADSMVGGAGNDIYIVDNAGDLTVEAAGEGRDIVRTSVTYTLQANIEDLLLTGSADLHATGNDLANVMTGNAGANSLFGMSGNDSLSGGAGNDTLYGGRDNDTLVGGAGQDYMDGGWGDDTYVVDDVGDYTFEFAAHGYDTVLASVNLTLADNIEALRMTGTADLHATGNDLANVMTGNAGANSLFGSSGNDSLSGGAGNDFLYGGRENDTLVGGAGQDYMDGGWGDDTYVVDDVGDYTFEFAAHGHDTVLSSVSFTLLANVEELRLTGGLALDGTGNELSNLIYGNPGANRIVAGGGNDTVYGGQGDDRIEGGVGDDRINGGIGHDRLWGGSGADVFEFRTAGESSPSLTAADEIFDFAAGDRIDVSQIDANASLSGNQAFVIDAGGAFSIGEIRQQQVAGDTVLTFNMTGDSAPEMTIIVHGLHVFTSADFFL